LVIGEDAGREEHIVLDCCAYRNGISDPRVRR
jgi:hypothetical protein